MAPIDATPSKIDQLPRSGHDLENYWILTDGFNVSIHQQHNGEASKQAVSVPKKDFDKLARWYFRQQRLRS
jgi:hypothetical protein